MNRCPAELLPVGSAWAFDRRCPYQTLKNDRATCRNAGGNVVTPENDLLGSLERAYEVIRSLQVLQIMRLPFGVYIAVLAWAPGQVGGVRRAHQCE